MPIKRAIFRYQADHQKKSQKATTKRQVLQNQYFVGLFLLSYGDLDRQKEGIDGQKLVLNSYPRQDFQKKGYDLSEIGAVQHQT